MISVRDKVYREKKGYLVCGTDKNGRRYRVWTEDYWKAKAIRRAITEGWPNQIDEILLS